MKPEIRRLVVVVGVTTLSGCGTGGDDGSGPTVAVSAQSRAATPEVIGVFSGYGGVFSFDTAGGDGAVEAAATVKAELVQAARSVALQEHR